MDTRSFVEAIKHLVGYAKSDYVLCFIPASTQWKTQRRYADLARRLQEATGVTACFNAIYRTEDHEAGHLYGGTVNPTEGVGFNSSCFRGKKVILIDDVITRGRTFCSTANSLLDRDASDVVGLFVAKTIHPNLPIASNSSRSIPYDIFEEVMAEQAYEDEMAAELAAEEAYEDDIAAELAAEAYYDEYPDEF